MEQPNFCAFLLFTCTGLIFVAFHIQQDLKLSMFQGVWINYIHGTTMDGYSGCKTRWDLNLNMTIENKQPYFIGVDPDQVYSVKSPGWPRLEYPQSGLYTWLLLPSEEDMMSIAMYILYFDTAHTCDILKISTFDAQLDEEHLHIQYNAYDYTYWSGRASDTYSYYHSNHGPKNKEFVESVSAVLQFNTSDHYDQVGFVVRAVPLLNSRITVGQHSMGYDVEFDAGSRVTNFTAGNRETQQLHLYSGSNVLKEYKVTIMAEGSSQRVFVNVLVMSSKYNNCDYYIEIVDGNNKAVELMKACRYMTYAMPTQIVSVTNTLVIKYKCYPVYLFNLKDYNFEQVPCAIINYNIYDPYIYRDKPYDPGSYHEITHLDFINPINFAGQFLRFSVKAHSFMSLLLTSEKEDKEYGIMKFYMYPFEGNATFMDFGYKEPFEYTEYSYKVVDTNMLTGTKFWDFWVTVEKGNYSLGFGHMLRANQQFTKHLSRNMEFKYLYVNADPHAVIRLYSDCENYLSVPEMRRLPTGDGVLYETVKQFSTYETTWFIQKREASNILQMKITAELLQSPDCEFEAVTFYRGSCPSWERKIAVVCGNVDEIYSDTTHALVIIKFKTKTDHRVINKLHGHFNTRSFRIKYKEFYTEPEDEPVNTGLIIAIVITVLVLVLVISVIAYLKIMKKKNKPRRIEPQDVHQMIQEPAKHPQGVVQSKASAPTQVVQPSPPMHLQHRVVQLTPSPQGVLHHHPTSQIPNMNEPIQLKIEIDNTGQLAGVPSTLYQRPVHTSVNYTGIPPPAVYDPPKAMPRVVHPHTLPQDHM